MNLPGTGAGRWGQGLTAGQNEGVRVAAAEVVGRFDFLEWTGADHLRHTKFVALGDDKDPQKFV